MNSRRVLITALVVLITGIAITVSVAQNGIFDLSELIRRSPDLADRVGWQKLSLLERNALNEIFQDTISKAQRSIDRIDSPGHSQPLDRMRLAIAQNGRAYVGRVRNIRDNTVELNNGAKVRIDRLGSNVTARLQDAVLFDALGNRALIWVEDVGTYQCAIDEFPRREEGQPAYVEMIDLVTPRGTTILGLGGRVYEVSTFDTGDADSWRSPGRALIIGDEQMVNLDDCNAIIRVTRLR